MTVFDEAKEHMMDLAAKIMSGICANPCLNAHWKTQDEAVEYALNSAEKIIIGANRKIREIKERAGKETDRESTGFVDATGKQILDGDIFIYNQWQFNGKVPEDLVYCYEEKYANTVCLHPVFWDEDEGMWASDVYGDCDRLGKYDFSKLFVVTNNVDNPELYNH